MNTGKLAIGAACAISAGAMVLALAGCGAPNPGSSSPSANSNTASSTALTSDRSASSTGSSSTGTAGTTVSPDELKAIDVRIGNGDYEAMEELAKKTQNGEMDGKIVEVNGYTSNFAKGMSYSVVEKSADGSKEVGTTFVIEGADEGSYPLDGQKTKIVGKIGKDANGYASVIHTLPEFVEVQI